MPIPGFATSDNGLSQTRLKGPVISGQISDNAGGPVYGAAGYIMIVSTAPVTQVVTTSASGYARAPFVYITVTTGPLTGAAAPAYAGNGTPIAWNDNLQTLQVWSSGKASWMTLVATTSMAVGGFTTSQ